MIVGVIYIFESAQLRLGISVFLRISPASVWLYTRAEKKRFAGPGGLSLPNMKLIFKKKTTAGVVAEKGMERNKEIYSETKAESLND